MCYNAEFGRPTSKGVAIIPQNWGVLCPSPTVPPQPAYRYSGPHEFSDCAAEHGRADLGAHILKHDIIFFLVLNIFPYHSPLLCVKEFVVELFDIIKACDIGPKKFTIIN